MKVSTIFLIISLAIFWDYGTQYLNHKGKLFCPKRIIFSNLKKHYLDGMTQFEALLLDIEYKEVLFNNSAFVTMSFIIFVEIQ